MMPERALPNLYFYRNFKRFTGGHLKVWHYFQYAMKSEQCAVKVFFSESSGWADNPWSSVRQLCLDSWQPEKASALFFGGMDWLALTEEQRHSPPAPVINLIQGVRHSFPANPLFQFLSYPATRICVSQGVADAILSTGRVNGDVVVNPNGLDVESLCPWTNADQKDIPLLIAGMKKPELAIRLGMAVKDELKVDVTVLSQLLPRSQYLDYVKRSRITVFLPNEIEGFYLPALEGMALGTLVICPDCTGNLGFCRPNKNCLMPQYNESSILTEIKTAFQMEKELYDSLVSNSVKTAADASMNQECSIFLKVLNKVFNQN